MKQIKKRKLKGEKKEGGIKLPMYKNHQGKGEKNRGTKQSQRLSSKKKHYNGPRFLSRSQHRQLVRLDAFCIVSFFQGD